MNFFYKAAIIFATISVASTGLHARPVIVRGNLMTSDTSGAVYEISSDGTKSILTNPAYATSYAASGGGTYNDGVYYMSKIWMSGYSSQTYSFDTTTSPWTSIASDGNGSSTMLSTDYAYDAVANVIYGFHKQSGSNYVIGKITPGSSWSRKLVQVQKGPDMVDVTINCSNADDKWHGLAFDSENQLWVITFGGTLNKVDKNSGVMTKVGETGIKPTVNGSAAFDFKTGKLYWAAKNAEGSFVYEVNTSSAEAVKVIEVPDNLQLMGIYIPEPAAEDGAPASPANVRYAFEDGAFSGRLLFDVPSTTFDDHIASGPVNYSVTIGDNETVTGTANHGDTNIEIPFAVEKSGKVAAQLHLENAVGKSPVTNYEAYIGYGKPESPSNVKLVYEEGKMNLSWDPVTSVSENEGYLGDVTYTIVRKSKGAEETVAENIAATRFEEEIGEPEYGLSSYTYDITAVNGDMTSDVPASSPSLTLGTLALPYENNFDTTDDFKALTTVNVEPASKTWVYSTSGKNLTLGYDKTYTKDDWLITPPIQLKKDFIYTVSISAKSQNARYPEKIALAWGNAPTVEDMTNTIVEPTEAPTTATTFENSFVAPENMKAYIGVHACSDADMSTLTVDDLKITEKVPTNIQNITDNRPHIFVNGKTIVVIGKGNVIIASVDGSIIRNTVSDGAVSTEVNSGIYIVNIDGNSTRVIVK